jgi:predicted RNA-binding Zn ribbon-like protein
MEFLCIDFINSQWYKTHKSFSDPIYDEIWLNDFYKKWDLSITGILDKGRIDKLLDLRNFLNKVINDIYSEKAIHSDDLDRINKYLSSFFFYKVLKKDNEKYYLCNVPERSGFNWIIFEIISSFIKLITEYDINRIKICNNPDCNWIFYDESKSKTRKWCDNTCATLMKVRRFRENKKNEKE